MFARLLYISGLCSFFFFNDTATTEIYTLSLHDALPISLNVRFHNGATAASSWRPRRSPDRSEEHTSELQSLRQLVCRLLLEKKKTYRSHRRGTRFANRRARSAATWLSRHDLLP